MATKVAIFSSIMVTRMPCRSCHSLDGSVIQTHKTLLNQFNLHNIIPTLNLTENTRNITDAKTSTNGDNMPTDYILGKLAKLTYTDDLGSRSRDERQAQPPEGWEQIDNTTRHSNTTYFGIAFYNEKEKTLVIAHRGSSPTAKGKLVLDLNAFERNKSEFPMVQQALAFSTQIRKSKSTIKDISYIETGYSLGGSLAEFNVRYLGGQAIVFDSPGLPFSFGCVLVKMSSHPEELKKSGQLNPLLENRDACILHMNDVFFYNIKENTLTKISPKHINQATLKLVLNQLAPDKIQVAADEELNMMMSALGCRLMVESKQAYHVKCYVIAPDYINTKFLRILDKNNQLIKVYLPMTKDANLASIVSLNEEANSLPSLPGTLMTVVETIANGNWGTIARYLVSKTVPTVCNILDTEAHAHTFDEILMTFKSNLGRPIISRQVVHWPTFDEFKTPSSIKAFIQRQNILGALTKQLNFDRSKHHPKIEFAPYFDLVEGQTPPERYVRVVLNEFFTFHQKTDLLDIFALFTSLVRANYFDAKLDTTDEVWRLILDELHVQDSQSEAGDKEQEAVTLDLGELTIWEQFKLFLTKINRSEVPKKFYGPFMPKLFQHTDDKGRMLLHYAAEYNQVDAISWFKQINPDEFNRYKNKQDKKGKTPIHLAVIGEQIEAVELLLDLGVDINLQDFQEHLPIHYGKTTNVPLLKLLVKKGSKLDDIRYYQERDINQINTPDYRQRVALIFPYYIAELSKRMHKKLGSSFSESKRDPLKPPISILPYNDNQRSIWEDAYLNIGTDTSLQSLLDKEWIFTCDDNHYTLLHHTTKLKKLDATKTIIQYIKNLVQKNQITEADAEIFFNFPNKDNRTALHEAVENRDVPMCEYFIQQQLSYQVFDAKGNATLYFIPDNYNELMVLYLSDTSSDKSLELRISDMLFPMIGRLLEALYKELGSYPTIKKASEIIRLQDETTGFSVFWNEIKKSITTQNTKTKYETALALLKTFENYHEADTRKQLVNHSPNSETQTLLHYLMNHYDGSDRANDLIRALLRYGINTGIGDINGNTALHIASMRNYCNAVALLLNDTSIEKNDCPREQLANLENHGNKVPLHLTTDPRIIELLVQAPTVLYNSSTSLGSAFSLNTIQLILVHALSILEARLAQHSFKPATLSPEILESAEALNNIEPTTSRPILIFNIPTPPTSRFLLNHSFFQNKYISEHRHESSVLQHIYDKRFGLIVKQ